MFYSLFPIRQNATMFDMDSVLRGTMTLRVRELRLAKGWSLKKLAEETGIPRSTLGEVEIYMRLPKKEQLERIAIALGIPVEDLYL